MAKPVSKFFDKTVHKLAVRKYKFVVTASTFNNTFTAMFYNIQVRKEFQSLHMYKQYVRTELLQRRSATEIVQQFIFIISATGWATGAQFPAGEMMGFFSSPPRPDRLWDPQSLLSNGYRWVLL
jgi:hypothetical protein